MRIVTRPDFDGVVCAVILLETLEITEDIFWVEPNDMQNGRVAVKEGDVIANLPYHKNCSMWFDHHFTNTLSEPVEGAFEIAPSAAGVVYKYFASKLDHTFDELIEHADRIDSGDITMDEVLRPEEHPYFLLSMTISGRSREDEPYWNRLVSLLRSGDIGKVMEDTEVIGRCAAISRQNRELGNFLQEHTTLHGNIAVTDFRSLEKAPEGNRFLVYSMFPEAVASVKIRYDNVDREKVILSVGHSIFNRNCRVNSGKLLAGYNGGGHFGAGACSFPKRCAEEYIPEIINTLVENGANDT